MWVRGMTRAGHSGCQGGLSPVQTQRGNGSCALIVLKNSDFRLDHNCRGRLRPPQKFGPGTQHTVAVVRCRAL